jgi:hypothetical protein
MASKSNLSRNELIEKYRTFSFLYFESRYSAQNRYIYACCMAAVNPSIHQVEYVGYNLDKKDIAIPCSLLLRDGTTVMAGHSLRHRFLCS